MAKALFNISDKLILLKLHAIAIEKSGLDKKAGFKAANSGVTFNGKMTDIDQSASSIRSSVDKLSGKDSTKIEPFSSKSGLYEAGIVVEDFDKRIRKDKSAFKPGASSKLSPSAAYAALQADSMTDEKALDKLKDEAFELLQMYMSAFCGQKYAESMPKDKIACEAYADEKDIEVVEDGKLGDQSEKTMPEAKALLFKIGYSVGAKKV